MTFLQKKFPPLIERCKLDFDRWSCLLLSLIGCANLVKMVALPKFTYTFFYISPSLLKSPFLDHSQLSSFLWGNKNPRIRKSVLQLPRVLGGLALPNFLHYYWSSNIHKILYWISNSAHEERPAWVDMELGSSKISLFTPWFAPNSLCLPPNLPRIQW